jgi:hypothetical protein
VPARPVPADQHHRLVTRARRYVRHPPAPGRRGPPGTVRRPTAGVHEPTRRGAIRGEPDIRRPSRSRRPRRPRWSRGPRGPRGPRWPRWPRAARRGPGLGQPGSRSTGGRHALGSVPGTGARACARGFSVADDQVGPFGRHGGCLSFDPVGHFSGDLSDRACGAPGTP